MSYRKRNTIILALQTLAICGIGLYLMLAYYPNQTRAVSTEIARGTTALSQRSERDIELARIEESIEEKNRQLSRWNKYLEKDVAMTDVLHYLNDVQAQYGNLKFTLTFVKEVKGTGFGYKVFTFSGEGDWNSIFALIWTLENGPKMFTIEKLSLRGVETLSENQEPDGYSRYQLLVPFSITVRAIYSDCADLPKPAGAGNSLIVQLPTGRNIFYPAILHDLPPNEDGLLESERAELKAILPGKVIVSDHSGKMLTLQEGDEVYLGHITRIDQARNYAEFLLNKGGIVEKFILKMEVSGE